MATPTAAAIDQAIASALQQQLLVQGAVASVVVLAVLAGLRFGLVHLIRGKHEVLDRNRRVWINRVNNGASITVVIALIMIWAPELQTFALSLTAIAVAVVIAFKELIMCLLGGVLQASAKPFDIGDWVTIDGLTGEVTRVTALTTVVEEINTADHSFQLTGRTVHIPNSRYLTANVQSADYFKVYLYHDVQITIMDHDLNAAALLEELRAISQEAYKPYRDAALKHYKMVKRKSGLDFAAPDPQCTIRTTDFSHRIFIAKLFLPTKDILTIETQIKSQFLAHVYALRQAVEASKSQKQHA